MPPCLFGRRVTMFFYYVPDIIAVYEYIEIRYIYSRFRFDLTHDLQAQLSSISPINVLSVCESVTDKVFEFNQG